MRQVMAREELDAEHLHRAATGRDAATQEAYLKSMSDMQRKQREKCAGRVALATSLKEDWGKWVAVLDSAARALQSRPEASKITSRFGDAESPALVLLETIRRKENRRAPL